MEGSITRAGLVFITYLFLMTVLFYTLSTPINSILVGIMNIEAPGLVGDSLTLYVPNYIRAMTIVFLLAVATPVVWFIFWVFSSEPIEQRVRRY